MSLKSFNSYTLGILFTFLIASFGYLLANVPGFDRVGPLACAIIIAIFYRQFFGYPEQLKAGIQFTAKYILRFAIILYGLKLNIQTILDDGIGLLALAAFSVTFAILVTIYLGKKLGADNELTLLLGVGTGVCGAAAIAATAPIIKAKPENTAVGIAIIALIGTVFSIIYTLIMPFLPGTLFDYAIWSGVSLHELAHVALAAEPAGDNNLAMALLAKLSRVFLLVPLSFVLIFWMKNKLSKDKTSKVKISFPYFLLGFIAMSLYGSYFLNDTSTILFLSMEKINFITTFLLAAAMVGLGLNVSLQTIRDKALRPLTAMVLASILLAISTFTIILFI